MDDRNWNRIVERDNIYIGVGRLQTNNFQVLVLEISIETFYYVKRNYSTYHGLAPDFFSVHNNTISLKL